MVTTHDNVHELVDLRDECLHQYREIWDAFSHDGQREAQVLRARQVGPILGLPCSGEGGQPGGAWLRGM